MSPANTGRRISVFNPETKQFKKIRTNLFFKTSISYDYTYAATYLNTQYLPYKDRFEDIWFGSFGGGASKYSPVLKNFKTYIPDPLDENSFPIGGSWGFCEDNEWIIWCSIMQNGLAGINKKTGKIVKRIVFNPDSNVGLNSGRITSISKDKDGYLWLSTCTGYCTMHS